MTRRHLLHFLLLVSSIAILLTGASVAQRRGTARREEGFRFRFVGPVVGNRIASVREDCSRIEPIIKLLLYVVELRGASRFGITFQ
jgi:hypothetical protein